MKKILLALLAVTALVQPALAKPVDPATYRRTLFAPVGQRMVALEAPVGMCFMDPSYPQEGIVVADMQSLLSEVSGGRLLGIFAPCMSVAALDTGSAGGAMSVFGMVTQLDPMAGDTTPLAPDAYLDLQEKKFRTLLDDNLGSGDDFNDEAGADDGDETASDDAAAMLSPAYAALMLPWPGDYKFDTHASRTKNAVTVGYTAPVSRGEKEVAAGVVATAVVRHVPLALYLNYTQKTPYDQKKIRDLADKFMAQEAVLNK